MYIYKKLVYCRIDNLIYTRNWLHMIYNSIYFNVTDELNTDIFFSYQIDRNHSQMENTTLVIDFDNTVPESINLSILLRHKTYMFTAKIYTINTWTQFTQGQSRVVFTKN